MGSISSKTKQTRQLRGVLLAASTLVTLLYFASCSGEKKKAKDEEPPRITVPPPVTSSPTGTTPESPGRSAREPDQKPLTLDGEWTFKQFTCTEGELTPWAGLENTLVSEEGYPSPEFSWHTGGKDRGTIRRTHRWTLLGDRAVRESTLAFHSSLTPGDKPTAWVTTRKRYAVNRISAGRLVLKHGATEGPFFQGLPLDPILTIIDNHIETQIARGGVVANLLTPIRNIQNFLRTKFSEPFMKSIMDFVNEFSQATESVNYTVDDTSLTFSQAQVSIDGFAAEPGVRIVDVASCGVNGKAVRTYERTDTADTDTSL
jgi:hypothetical protein